MTLSFQVWVAGVVFAETGDLAELPVLDAEARDTHPGATPSLLIVPSDFWERTTLTVDGVDVSNVEVAVRAVKHGYEIASGVTA